MAWASALGQRLLLQGGQVIDRGLAYEIPDGRSGKDKSSLAIWW